MKKAEVDSYPLTDLPGRYSVTRSVIYNRLGALKIEPRRSGKKAFVTAEELKLLDSLDEHLKRGGITSEFTSEMSSIHTATDARQVNLKPGQANQIESQSAILALMQAIANRLSTLDAASTHLSDYEALERAYRNGWLLSTSHLATLLGLSPKTLVSHKELSRYGFLFTKEGRNGTETAWKVSKS
ncbi:MAG: hypothetical protein AB4426_14345 [Xenococcaceae cyanobacterium]